MIDQILHFVSEHKDLVFTGGSIAGLMILSAFFSGSETALTAASRPRMHALEKDGQAGAARVNRLIADSENLIGAILLGNNLANIVATSLATSIVLKYYGQSAIALVSLGMTLLVLVFAEVLPKTYAFNNADNLAMKVSGPVAFFVRIFAPPVRAVRFLCNGVLRLIGGRGAQESGLAAMEEIRGAIDLHASRGRVDAEERHQLGGVLDLRDLSIGDVMIHRQAIHMLDADLPPMEILRRVSQGAHTRVPLYEGDKEEIIGVLHTHDLLSALVETGVEADRLDVRALAKPPSFVPETTSLQDQLDVFLRDHSHFSLVVDEYGALMGLVTLEDILEEIVGDIADEQDVHLEGVRPQSDGSVMVDGWVSIRDLNRAMNWDLPDEEAVTLAGLVIHEAQTIPEAGRRFMFHGYEFDILGKQRNQLTLLRVRQTASIAS